MKNLHCGSYWCRGGHVWLFEGTIDARLSTVNCYPEKAYSQEKMDIMNKTKDLFSGKHANLWNMK
jgi:hypothetical protein